MAIKVTVAKGDTLSAIAKENKTTVAKIAAANPQITNVNKINVGQKITIPTATTAKPVSVPKPVAPTSGEIPGFTPTPMMPTSTLEPGQPGFVGPFVPKETPWTMAGTVNTLQGLVNVDASGRAKDGSIPIAITEPFVPGSDLNTGQTKTQVDSIAAIKALLSSYGIGELGDAITNAVVKGYSTDTIQLIMQDPNSTDPLAVAFQMRFPANKARAAAGKTVLSPAEYLRAERSYTEVLKSYGVSNLASKEKLSQFISNDISATEVSDRVGLAINRVQNADADTKKALAEYYPMLNQADIVGAVLDPTEGLPALQRKIQIAEIGGAALAQGIKTSEGKTNILMGAETLANLGVTQAKAREGFQQVAEVAPRGEFLSQISPGENYGQLQAEQEAFQGLASAKRARLSLTEQERARFGGASGVNKASLASQTRGAI
jgi:murein DD-endopeptidase MepM/ murein hydrolase activator NlpD